MARKSTLDLVAALEQVVTAEETARCMEAFPAVRVSADVAGYILDIVEKTRKDSVLVAGVSTRGAMALYRACQVTAALEGRDYVIPEDVKREAIPVLAHRLSSGSSVDTEQYITKILHDLPVPMEAV